MNHKIITTAIFLLSSMISIGQNKPPKLMNVEVRNESDASVLTITYDLIDTDSDLADVDLQLVKPNGEILEYNPQMISGDIGEGVFTGKNKQVKLIYNSLLDETDEVAVELTADNTALTRISQIVALANLDRIEKDLDKFSRPRYFEEDVSAVKKVKKIIERQFKRNGLITERQEFLLGEYRAHNIIGKIPGRSNEDRAIVVGAHFDAVEGTEGADDNASGIAGMLEIMRVLSKYEFENTIYFVAFDLEEQGLLGSQKFVDEYSDSLNSNIEWAINLDMIGFYSDEPNSQVFPGALKTLFPAAYEYVSNNDFKGNFILGFCNEYSVELTTTFKNSAQYVDDLNIVTLDVPDDGNFAPGSFRSSDHVSFWDSDIKAISIGDTANARNFNYHSNGDIRATVNTRFTLKVVKATIATVVNLATLVDNSTTEKIVRLNED